MYPDYIKKSVLATVRKYTVQLENEQNTWTDISPKKDTWITDKYMKIWSTSLSTKDMQIESLMRYHYIPVIRIAAITILTKCWWECGASGSLIHCWGGCKI